MLDAFKTQKPIHQLKPGEEAYLQPGGILRDESGRFWLNKNATVSRKYSGMLTPPVRRIDENENGYEIDTTFALTPYSGRSENFRHSPDLMCLDEDEHTVRQLHMPHATVPRVQENPQEKPYHEILQPLYQIFMAPGVINEVLIRTSIPEIIRNEKPIFNGVILYGEGGTGKTALQKAISAVFRNAGAHAEELNVAALADKYIGSLAHNLDEKISGVLRASEKSGKPAFIFLDEATSLVMSAATHNSSGMDYYQEAVDVLKKYISNYPNLVFSITTNAKPDIFDDTLIREGRLTPVHIPLPGEAEQMRMWAHFLEKYDVMNNLTQDQFRRLAGITPLEQGAFIEGFCKAYLPRKKLTLETEMAGGTTILDALAQGKFVSLETVRQGISFEILCGDVEKAISEKYPEESKKMPMGFF